MASGGEQAFTYHGGRLGEARRIYADAPEPWIDLSTGINARPYPLPPLDPALIARLPEPRDIARLEAVAADAYGCSPTAVVAVPGTEALIRCLPHLFPARRVGILGFTYAEHARAWTRSGAKVETVMDGASLDAFDVGVVVNPNNPDGRLVDPEVLANIAARRASRDALLVVDEAFADLIPGTSLTPRLPAAGTVILRSFGKTFGLAGLRLGFAVASADLVPTIRDAVGPWAVGGVQIDVGCRALADRAWRDTTRERLAGESARLDALLARAGAQVIGGTPLFRLARFAANAGAFERLARAGILVRPFAGQPGLLRFGIPGKDEHWKRLGGALGGPANEHCNIRPGPPRSAGQ